MTPVTEISLVLFDLNGVLYGYDREARIAQLSLATKKAPDDVKAAIWDSGFEDTGDTGALDAAGYLRGFGASLGCDLSEADWVIAQQAAVTPMVATLALLSRIRSGVSCAVLTNNNLLVLKHFSILYPEIIELVGDRACVSAEFGTRKPNVNVYRKCLIRLGAAPAAALFVGDSPANVAGARAAGLLGFEYAGAEALETDLDRVGLLIR